MLNSILLTIFLCIASTLLTIEVALSQPLMTQGRCSVVLPLTLSPIAQVPAQPSPSPPPATTEQNSTPETLEPQPEVEKTPTPPSAEEKPSPPSDHPYDMEAIEEFERDLYGD
jgi:hypothetical protein